MQFRNDIQGLRALAFLFVFIFHLNHSWLPGGFIGVDIFFVISGYLITSILMHQKAKGTFSFLTFYEKRIKRIVPAHFILVIFVLIAVYFVYLYYDIKTLRGSILGSALFISNIVFARGESYFGVGLSDNPLLHTWSLSIEMQFYFILPLLIIFIKNKYLPYVMGGLIILFTGYSTYQMMVNHATSSMYFSLLARMPEFFVGSLLSLIFLKRKPINKNNSLIISTIGLLAIFGSAIFMTGQSTFPGVLALIPTIGTGLLLISEKNIFSDLLSKKVMVHIGELSYSLYLWHWPIMAFMRYQEGMNVAYDFTVYEILFISVSTYVLAWLSYTFIENVFRTTGNKKFILSFSPVVVFLLVLAFTIPVLAKKSAMPDEYIMPTFGTESNGKKNIETFGNASPTYDRIFLFGDSHALAIKPFLDYIGKQNNFSFRTITTSGYPSIGGVIREEVPAYSAINYEIAQTFIDTTLIEVAKNDIIIINSIGFDRLPSMKIALNNFAKNLRSNQSLIILNTFPIIGRNPVRVNKSIVKSTDFKFQVSDRSRNKELIEEIVNKYDNVYYYDLSKSKVFNSPPFYKDTLMYYDQSHLNVYGAVEMAKDLDADFMTLLDKLINKYQ
ncbi:acyltransferase family protein [Albibacterium bauzanense]|uniref:Peptidoglycan/LPS O-acetylase OafA/YrhL n=1 Tax=Albibacterium bauzanense TaxID=653929 RepID=A0A4R1M1P6_9SPHI|nr:acyltransferase family protein [Albibacterium bauzanense]TCK84910.1 peptidoglycan/LPS O-acetylase OafA/YrhL [Albibacterium bauzanense]